MDRAVWGCWIVWWDFVSSVRIHYWLRSYRWFFLRSWQCQQEVSGMLDPSYFGSHPLYGFWECASGLIWNRPSFIARCSLQLLFFTHLSVAMSYRNPVPSSNVFSLLHLNDLLWKSWEVLTPMTEKNKMLVILGSRSWGQDMRRVDECSAYLFDLGLNLWDLKYNSIFPFFR